MPRPARRKALNKMKGVFGEPEYAAHLRDHGKEIEHMADHLPNEKGEPISVRLGDLMPACALRRQHPCCRQIRYGARPEEAAKRRRRESQEEG